MGFLESNSDVFCGKELRKYFFLVAAAAIMILLGTYWYKNYYTQGVDVDITNAHIDYPTPAGPVVNPIVSQRANTPRRPTAGIQAPNTVAVPLPVAGGFAEVAARLKKSVVNVNVARSAQPQTVPAAQNPAPAPSPGGVTFANPSTGRTVETIGSGVIIRPDGYIVTNYHVVQSGAVVYVTVFNDVGNERYRAEVIKLDEVRDLALLRIRPKTRLTAAHLGDSNRMRVADPVLAIGSPFGLDQTVSKGVISGIGKTLLIEGIEHTDLMQTDAAINQGNSGGPLVDRNGYVIGINTAIYSPTGAFAGIGFAIASNQAVRFVRDEVDLRGGMANSAMGLNAAAQGQLPMPPPITRGVASPHTDGREQMNCASCHQMLGAATAGRPVAGMTYAMPGAGMQGAGRQRASVRALAGPPIMAGTPAPHRDGRENMVCSQCHQMLNPNVPAALQFAQPPVGLGINVAATSINGGAIVGPRVMGATVLPIDELLSERLNQPVGKGVFISAVIPGSPMDKSGIHAGDVLLKLNGRRLRSPRQLIRRMGEIPNGVSVRFGILRGGQRSDVNVQLLAMSMPGPAAARQAQKTPRVPNEFTWRGIDMEITPVPAANANMVGPRGARVDEVAGGSLASKAGVLNNDVILMIDAFTVDTAARLDKTLRAIGQTQPVWLKISRGGREVFVKLG